ncbi:MAG TPA: hypothetical protein VFW40_01990, partial [Capsulimonadaceae bacterium]|nr:hypothetical protein [Capsulimonadaceae bacterium]
MQTGGKPLKRMDLRGLCCASLGIGLLIASYPARAQQPAPAAPPAAKAAAHPAKPVKATRWAPRRWSRYSRWNRYSRWARRPYVKPAPWKPVVAAAPKPGYVKPASAAAYTLSHPKPVAKPAAPAKPAVKTAWRPATA